MYFITACQLLTFHTFLFVFSPQILAANSGKSNLNICYINKYFWDFKVNRDVIYVCRKDDYVPVTDFGFLTAVFDPLTVFSLVTFLLAVFFKGMVTKHYTQNWKKREKSLMFTNKLATRFSSHFSAAITYFLMAFIFILIGGLLIHLIGHKRRVI